MEANMRRSSHFRKRRKLKKVHKYIFFSVLFMVIFLTYGLWPRDGHGSIRQDFASPSDTYEDLETNCHTITSTAAQTVQPTPSIEPTEPTPEVEPRYGFTEDEIYLLAQLLCGDKSIDGDGEYDIDYQKEINYYEVSKVLCVVMNRVRSKDYPNMVTDVVLQKGQFSVMPQNADKEPSDIALQTVREWCEAYDNHANFIQVVPNNHLFFTGDGKINTTRAKYK